MANNKVQLANGTVLIDLTSDTVSPELLPTGITAHDMKGEKITGTMAIQYYRTGHGDPPSDLKEGDLYFDLG